MWSGAIILELLAIIGTLAVGSFIAAIIVVWILEKMGWLTLDKGSKH